MLVYQAQTGRDARLFSDFAAAKHWVEANSEGYWKQNSVDSWVICSGITGAQLGIVYKVVLDTSEEDDPLRKLAFAILSGDPMALDAAKDVLKC